MSNNEIKQRETFLGLTLNAASQAHKETVAALNNRQSKVELILVAWGFLLSGIAGFYQVDVLNKHNTQQVIALIIPILVSLILCIVFGIYRTKIVDVPNLPHLWSVYVSAVNSNLYDLIGAKEQLVQAYISAERTNRKKLDNINHVFTWASLAVIIEVILLIVFILAPDLQITI